MEDIPEDPLLFAGVQLQKKTFGIALVPSINSPPVLNQRSIKVPLPLAEEKSVKWYFSWYNENAEMI